MKHLSVMFALILTLGMSLCITQNLFLSVLALSPPDITSIPQVKNSVLPERSLDRFGIEMIYPTKIGGEQWYINMQNPTADGRFDPQDKITRNPDGSWKMKSDKVRMGVYTSRGYYLGDVSKTLPHSELMKRGYMQSNSDWKNVEITGYVKLNAYSENDNFVWYTRGGKHSDSDPCEGAGYKGNLNFFGQVQFSKEQWHVSYVKSPYKQGVGPLQGHWTGFKFIEYNLNETQGTTGQVPVKLEIWVDADADGKNWKKVYEGGDAGHWGRTDESCGGLPDQVIGWGGPVAAYRWDFAQDVDFKDLSVREIVPVGGVISNISFFDGVKSGYGDEFGSYANGKSLSNNSRLESENIDSVGSTRSLRNNNSSLEIKSIPLIHILRNDSDVVKSPFEHNKEKTFRVGNTTYVLSVEGDEDNTDIYLKISHNNGLSFGKPINLSNNPASLSYNPDLAESNGNIYIVWEDDSGNSGNTDIFFIKSADNGATWSERKNLSNDPSGSGDPRISVIDGNIYVTWLGTTPDKPNMQIVESKDNGLTFSNEIDFNPKHDSALNGMSNATFISTVTINDTSAPRHIDNNANLTQNTPSNFTNYEALANNGTKISATFQQNNSSMERLAFSSKNLTLNHVTSSDRPLALNNSGTMVEIAKQESYIQMSNSSDNPYLDIKRNTSKIETDLTVHPRQDDGLRQPLTNIGNALRNDSNKQFEHREDDTVVRAQAKTALQKAESNLDNLQSSIFRNRNGWNSSLSNEIARSNIPPKTIENKENQITIDSHDLSKNATIQAENSLHRNLHKEYFDYIGPHSNDKQIKIVNNSSVVSPTVLSSQRSQSDPTIPTISKNQSFSPANIDKNQIEYHSHINHQDNPNSIDIVSIPNDLNTALQQAETKLRSMKDVHLTEKIEKSNYKNKLVEEPDIPIKLKNRHNVVPSAEGNKVNTLNDKSVVIRLPGKDNDGPKPLSFTIVNQPRHGKINAFNEHLGKLTYVPNNGYTGQDSFKFIVSDGISDSKVAVISIKIDQSQVPHTGNNFNKEKITTNIKKSTSDSQVQEQFQTKKKGANKSTEENLQGDRVSKLEDRAIERDIRIDKNGHHENKPEDGKQNEPERQHSLILNKP